MATTHSKSSARPFSCSTPGRPITHSCTKDGRLIEGRASEAAPIQIPGSFERQSSIPCGCTVTYTCDDGTKTNATCQ